MVKVFANGPGELGSIPSRFMPKKTQIVFDAAFLNTQHYKVRIKGKVEQSRERSSALPTPWCSSYRKGSLQVTLDYGNQLISLEGREFINGPGDLCSIPGRVIPKTLKTVLDTSLINTHHYKVRIKSKVEQSRERSSALPNTSV